MFYIETIECSTFDSFHTIFLALTSIFTCDDDVIQKDDFVRVSGAATCDAMFGHVNQPTIDFYLWKNE